MALAISVPNLAGIHQSILKLYQTARHPALPPDLGACPWRLSFACDSRGSRLSPRGQGTGLGGGRDVRGEVWFGSPHKGIPPVLTILLCSLKLHDIWVMLLI